MVKKNTLYTAKFLNARNCIIESTYKSVYEWLNKKKGFISKIKINNENTYSLGDCVYFTIEQSGIKYNTYYKINKIQINNNRNFQINEFNLNETSIFIVPLVFGHNYIIKSKSFVNAYVRHYNYDSYIGEQLYVIYRYLPFESYGEMAKYIGKNPNFIDYVKDKDKRFDVFIMQVPEQFNNDTKLLMKGKFSKITEAAKHNILDFHRFNTRSQIYQVLYKSEFLRKEKSNFLGVNIPEYLELRTIPDVKVNEIWNYSKKK